MASKDEIRSSHRAARSALPLAAQDTAAAGIARHGLEWASGIGRGRQGTFAAYLGVGAEPPTLPLLTALVEAGHKVLLPGLRTRLELSWVYWTPPVRVCPQPVRPHPGACRRAPRYRGHADATAIFLPATAVDFSGNRIGRAAATTTSSSPPWLPCPRARRGVDRRRVSRCRLPPSSMTRRCCPAGSIPAESFDRKVDAALTPGGIIRLG